MASPAYQDGNSQRTLAAVSLTFTIPAGASQGDFMIVFVKQSENTGAQEWDDDGGGGNGWTRLDYHRTTSGRDQETAIFYKFHDGSESNPTFTWWSGGTNSVMSGIFLVYDNVDTVEPINDFAWQWAQNDCNPPNPDAEVSYINTKVICFHAATHDDISSVGAPTGFTIRDYQYGGSAQHTWDHTDIFSADIEIDTIATYSPPDWTHGAANTTPEYHTYTVALNELQPIHLTSPATGTKMQWNDTNKTVGGDGFESTQGTGKLELWSDTNDDSGTVKTAQSIDSWSDTSIQYDVTQGSLVDGINYLVVTNDTGDVSNKRAVNIGFGPYAPIISTDADLYWKMNNSYDDDGARNDNKPFNAVQRGTPTFSATPICRTNTHSFNLSDSADGSEPANSDYTNITNTHTYRNVGGWVRIEALQTYPAIIYEEGGGVNNIYALMMPNGRLMINVADSSGDPDFKYQHYSDFALTTARPYYLHIAAEFGDHFDLYIDGVLQTADHAGTLGSDTTMSTHSGDWSFGDPGANLDTGGVDIAYNACNPAYLAHWGTWSGIGGGAPLTTAQIRDELFREGALAEHTISAGTEAAMQTAMDAYDSQTHKDWPLTYDIEDVTGGGDLNLDITDQVWPDECKFHIRWLGGGTLTIRNLGTSNFETSKAYSPTEGTIAVIETVSAEITVKDAADSTVLSDARVLLLAATGGPLPFEDSISITRSGYPPKATVTHTAHGLVTENKILIESATQNEYNGIKAITITSVNTYTFTVSGSPTTPATGSPTATSVIIDDDTDSEGIALTNEHRYTSSQPVSGKARLGSTSPFYKPGSYSGTITSSGLSGNIFLVGDE